MMSRSLWRAIYSERTKIGGKTTHWRTKIGGKTTHWRTKIGGKTTHWRTKIGGKTTHWRTKIGGEPRWQVEPDNNSEPLTTENQNVKRAKLPENHGLW
jgi:hypothetical protein